MSVRAFTLPTFERLTPDLTGPERLAVFLGLPVDMQSEAWMELGRRIEAQSRERFAEERLGGWATSQEIADEIALIWRGEIRGIPLGGVEPAKREASRGVPAARGRDDDALMEISPTVYVAILTGREIGRDGKVDCPFHDGGDERTASLHVYDDPARGWYCFACGRGGTIVDLAAELYGIEPRGQGFHDIRRRLIDELLGGAP